MIRQTTIDEIRDNINTGIEYEIALFYCLLGNKPEEQRRIMEAIETRRDCAKVKSIIAQTNVKDIELALHAKKLVLFDASFETQNDEVGPADIVLYVYDKDNNTVLIGLSVKYANTCTLNVTGRNFITDQQIDQLRQKLPDYTRLYIEEMSAKYGGVENWFRKRKPSQTTDQYIDLIRDAIIDNWPNVNNKTLLLSALFHKDSPIEFWVVTYDNKSCKLNTEPRSIDISRADEVSVGKYQASFIAFYLEGRMIGHMQVKFNNGFVEKCKKAKPDIVFQGVEMVFGHPFNSWNFNVEK